MDLENILRDPKYKDTTFVMIHGGFPYDRESIWLAAVPNVYLDSSEFVTLVYPGEYSHVLKLWFETFPEKVVLYLGRMHSPTPERSTCQQRTGLAIHTARTAAAAALSEMVSQGEITEPRALQIAREYFHDTTAELFGLQPLQTAEKK